MTYILIFGFWAGTLSGGDSVSLTSMEFNSQQSCEVAGQAAMKRFDTIMKTPGYVCVQK